MVLVAGGSAKGGIAEVVGPEDPIIHKRRSCDPTGTHTEIPLAARAASRRILGTERSARRGHRHLFA
jgi:hypothetical protein